MSEFAEGSEDTVWASGTMRPGGTAVTTQSDGGSGKNPGGGATSVDVVAASVVEEELARFICSITEPVLAEILISEGELSASSSRAFSEVGGQTTKPPPARTTVDEVIDAVAAGINVVGTQAEGIVPGTVLPEAVRHLSRR